MIEYDYESQSIEGYNTKLRLAYVRKTPIIYLKQIKPGVYKPSINLEIQEENGTLFILEVGHRKDVYDG
jgi:mRNA-degrading endonuclease RelE of RelBE toxin-antitoxin system